MGELRWAGSYACDMFAFRCERAMVCSVVSSYNLEFLSRILRRGLCIILAILIHSVPEFRVLTRKGSVDYVSERCANCNAIRWLRPVRAGQCEMYNLIFYTHTPRGPSLPQVGHAISRYEAHGATAWRLVFLVGELC